MTDLEIKVLKEVYDLNHIDDLSQLREAIRARDAQMNALDRIEIQMRIGRKVNESLAASHGSLYSPANSSLLISAVFLAGLSTVTTIWAIKSQAWLVFRITAGMIAFVLFAAACRATVRVVYRFIKQRDF